MITFDEFNTYNACGDARMTDADLAEGAALLDEALTSATNTAANRVAMARLAFETAAHYSRLFEFDGLDEYALTFAADNVEFYTLRATLLLSSASEREVNAQCVALLKSR